MIAVADPDALRPAWLRLWEADARATPFTHPDWLIAWWRSFGDGSPCLLTALENGGLGMLLPLYRPAGAPDMARALGAGVSDVFDVLGQAAAPERLALALQACAVGSVDLAAVPEGSPLLGLRLPGWRCMTAADTVSPGLPLPEGIAATMRARLAYERRRAARTGGGLTVETVGADALDAWFATLLRLHASRWAVRGESGVLAHPAVAAFHRDVVRAFAEAGMLRAYLLRIGGTVAAAYYGFAAKRQSFYYIAGFDPNAARFSPGVLVVGHAIEAAAAEGSTRFHFLRGGEAYKYRWGARDCGCFRVSWAREAR